MATHQTALTHLTRHILNWQNSFNSQSTFAISPAFVHGTGSSLLIFVDHSPSLCPDSLILTKDSETTAIDCGWSLLFSSNSCSKTCADSSSKWHPHECFLGATVTGGSKRLHHFYQYHVYAKFRI